MVAKSKTKVVKKKAPRKAKLSAAKKKEAKKKSPKKKEVKKEAPKAKKSTPPKEKAQTKALVKKSQEVEVLGKDPLSQIRKEVNGLKHKQSLKLARELTESIDCNYFKLGGTLAKISDEEWWESEGYSSFQVYTQAELGMPYRKAMYLISIYNHLVESGIPYEKVKNIGWSKLKEIAPVLNEDNVDEWVDTAEQMNSLQLIEEIKDYKKGDLDDDSVAEKVKNAVKSKIFKLHEEQQQVVEEAIEAAKDASGSEFDSVALEYICLDFLGKPFKSKAKPKKAKKEKEEEVDEEDWDEDDWEEDDDDSDLDF